MTIGIPFADPNFKLVVMDELLSKRAIELGEPSALAKQLLGPAYNEERDGYQLLKPVYDYLVRYPLSPAHLAAVEQLIFDAGNQIYTYAFPFWDGEGGEFNVSSLKDIELLPNLRVYNEASLLEDDDLSPLAPLVKLEEVGLSLGSYRNVRTLLDLPALREFQCFDGSLDDPSVIEALKARGVTVKIYR